MNQQTDTKHPESISVIIVEDEPLLREMLTHMLNLETNIQVVGSCDNGIEAVRLAGELRPDVVLMDLELKDGFTGFEAGLQIKRQRAETGIVILSSHESHGLVSNLPLEASLGWSYLLKRTVSDLPALVRTIVGTKNGLVILDPAIVVSLNLMNGSKLSGLTPRQMEVLELVAQGFNNASIAKKLGISTKSVDTHINAMYRKLDIREDPGTQPRVKACILYLENTQY